MQDKFEFIKKKYIATFSHKHEALKAAWDENDITLLHDLLHKLAGSSGGYGFDDLYFLCRHAMELTETSNFDNHQKIEFYMEQIFVILKDTHI